MNSDLRALFALQQVDSALSLAVRRYKALDQGVAEKAAAETATTLHERMVRALHETEGDLKDSELEQQAVEKKRKDFESKLYGGRVQNPKELSAMQEEIEALGRQRGRLDEKILALMDQLETRRAEEAGARARRQEAEAALKAKQSEYKKAATAQARLIRDLQAEREVKVRPIPAGLLRRYDSLKAAKQGVAIGAISDAVCGACHTNLPSMLVRRVQETTDILTCENCGRLLCIA